MPGRHRRHRRRADDDYFEVTFQGEVHDTPMSLAFYANNLTTTAGETQTLYIPVTSSGQFYLNYGAAYGDATNPAGHAPNQTVTQGQTPPSISFSAPPGGNLTVTATNIQNDINTLTGLGARPSLPWATTASKPTMARTITRS